MTASKPEPFDAITEWVDRNSRIAQDAVVRLTLQQGHVPDGSRRKATLGLESADKLALVEAWSSGEMDFTMHDFSVSEEGHTTHMKFSTFDEFSKALDACYEKFTKA